ncbi:MAG: hypothetical protein HRU04_24110 [Oceanospirillaceae bacterium]|nr:hypothetical protein [Oceanospirillaceae bacterium]
MRIILILLSTIAIQGCTSDFFEIKYAPIPKSDVAYALIGNECDTSSLRYLIGWENFDNNGVIDSYVLEKNNNVGSRHIVDRIELPKNSRMRIVSIERSSNWKILDDKYKFNIKIEGLAVKVHRTEDVARINLNEYDVCSTLT